MILEAFIIGGSIILAGIFIASEVEDASGAIAEAIKGMREEDDE